MSNRQPGADGSSDASTADTSFVGRSDELARLDLGLDAAQRGEGGLFLLTGEAGIGKTRLASETARRAAGRGFDVLWGRCWEDEGAPAYWPWTQILRGLADARSGAALASLVGALGADSWVSALVPDIVDRVPGLAPIAVPATAIPSQVESERARFALFDGTTELLRRAAGERPLVLVFDDVHTADLPSLLLLKFVARALPEMAMMVVVTQREADARLVEHGQEVFAALERSGTRLALRGWSRLDVGRYVESVLGSPPSRLVEVIHEVTAGNPLFVDGFARTVRDDPSVELLDGFPFGMRIPDSVRGAVRDRLRPLPPQLTPLLAAAAVVGRRFDLRVLAATLEQPLEEIVRSLDIAVKADLLVVAPEQRGRYSFSHPLVRDAVYAEIDAAERLRLHRRIAVVLEEIFSGYVDEHAGEIAHHYFEAARADDVERAVHFARRAAERAVAQYAYEGAVVLYRRALAALESVGGSDSARCELQVALGEAYLRAGNAAKARQTCSDAALLARRLGAGELLARAALTFGGIPIGPGILDPELIGLLEESRRYLGPEPTALKAIVCARLAVRLHTPVDNSRRASLCREALEAARLSESDEAMAYALDARHLVHWAQTDLQGQLAIADQVMDAAERCGNRELFLHSHQLRINDYLEMGAIDAVDLEIDRYERLATELRQDLYIFRSRVFRAMRAMVEGDFERSERLSAEAFELGRGIQTIVAATYFGVQATALERLRGRPGSTEASMLGLLEAYPSVGALRVALAALYADFGRRDEAAAALERVAPDDLYSIPMDNNWLIGAALTADVCAYLGDRTRGATVFEMILPFAGRNPVGASGAACNGCVSRQLGQLAFLLGRPQDAFDYFQDAITRDLRMGARPFVLRTQLDLAGLLASPEGADAGLVAEPLQRARALALDVHRGALSLGMERSAKIAAELLAQVDAAPSCVAPSASTQPVFRLDGDYWTIRFEDEKIRLKDIRGLHHIARLLAAPQTEIHCLDLASDSEGSRMSEGSAGPSLDARAKAEYRGRTRELRAELAEAESFNDIGRAERVRAELEALAQQLSHAVGIGGRDRGVGSAAERARVAVAKSIRLALGRIAKSAPRLGAHLDATVRTGVACVYKPDPRSALTWDVGQPG